MVPFGRSIFTVAHHGSYDLGQLLVCHLVVKALPLGVDQLRVCCLRLLLKINLMQLVCDKSFGIVVERSAILEDHPEDQQLDASPQQNLDN